MKIRVILIGMFLFCGIDLINAQTTLKIGHVNVQELVQKHPATDSIQAVIEQEAKDMEEVFAEMLEEQETKLNQFEAENEGYSDFVRKTKQDELLELSQKIETFNQTAQQQLRQRNINLLQPVYDEVNEAIKSISSENNFTYVLDISSGVVAYLSPDSQDITARVLELIQHQ